MDNFQEKSPPGWGGTVWHMKHHHGDKIDNPWALAWYMKNKGDKAHYEDDKDGSKAKKAPKKKKKYSDEKHESLSFKEWLKMVESNLGT